ncbi:hypothetical protein DL93DRAFT_2076338 [Clavulina sp. PMI_390]|nr:hypothetical protein DL93DRAFT_2076338 [Clavulina sp. PMI_390]
MAEVIMSQSISTADPAPASRWEDGSLEDKLGPFLFDLLFNLPHNRRDDALRLFVPPSEEDLDDQRLEKQPPPRVEPWPELKGQRVLDSARKFEKSRMQYRLLAWILAIFLLPPATIYLVCVALLVVGKRLLSVVNCVSFWSMQHRFPRLSSKIDRPSSSLGHSPA